ncbi:hypothetical protein ACHHYP_02113 [Achlya hypogyna]|uniref:Importin-like protein n=1 Tax=Achlya hypogyna TaxID=1202772 RepID=A0A1V9Z7A6_ACHHY|nr:hypothetical protein ACHHYP_02113 [Achlya hypogyna]
MNVLVTNAGSKAIADIVKEHVHSTSIGEAGTRKWTEELLADLKGQFTLALANMAPSVVPNETDLGTLLSAAGLTIRYVTETGAFKEYLEQFQAIFLQVLELPHWSKPYLGLKMVAVRGCSRLCECFEATTVSVAAALVPWAASALDQCATDTLAIQLLFRPICEFLNVVVQTQPSMARTILTTLVPAMLRLHTNTFAASKDFAQDILEWNTLLGVVLEQLLPSQISARELLATAVPMPRGTVETLGFAAVVPPEEWEALLETLPTTASVASMAMILPSLYRLAQLEYPANVALATLEKALAHAIDCLQEVPWNHPSQLELAHGLVETVRDLLIAAYVAQGPVAVNTQSYPTLEYLALHLPTVAKDRMFKSVKAMLPDLRDATSECFIALMYTMGSNFWAFQASFVRDVALKLADPLVFGDMLHVLRPTAGADTAEFEALVASVATMLTKGLQQIPRYSKPMALRLLGSVGHTVQGAGSFIAPHAATIAALLTGLHGGSPSAARDAYVTALTELYLAMPFTDGETVESFCEILAAAVLTQKVTGLESLQRLLAFDPTWVLAKLPAEFWTQFLEMCTEALTSFPVFEEDVPTIVLQLGICTALLPHQRGMEAWSATVLAPMVATFHTAAHEEGLVEVEEASRALLTALQS